MPGHTKCCSSASTASSSSRARTERVTNCGIVSEVCKVMTIAIAGSNVAFNSNAVQFAMKWLFNLCFIVINLCLELGRFLWTVGASAKFSDFFRQYGFNEMLNNSVLVVTACWTEILKEQFALFAEFLFLLVSQSGQVALCALRENRSCKLAFFVCCVLWSWWNFKEKRSARKFVAARWIAKRRHRFKRRSKRQPGFCIRSLSSAFSLLFCVGQWCLIWWGLTFGFLVVTHNTCARLVHWCFDSGCAGIVILSWLILQASLFPLCHSRSKPRVGLNTTLRGGGRGAARVTARKDRKEIRTANCLKDLKICLRILLLMTNLLPPPILDLLTFPGWVRVRDGVKVKVAPKTLVGPANPKVSMRDTKLLLGTVGTSWDLRVNPAEITLTLILNCSRLWESCAKER